MPKLFQYPILKVLCVHYQQIMKEAHQVPASILFAKVQSGKSLAEEAALFMMGVREQFFRHGTDMKMAEVASQTTLGFVLDGQSKPNTLAEKLLTHFEQRKVVSPAGIFISKTTFIASVNMECLTKLSKQKRYVVYVIKRTVMIKCRLITRAVLVPFGVEDKEYSLTPAQRRKADAALHKSMKAASAGAGFIISLGARMRENSQLEDVMERVESLLAQCTLQRM